MAVILKDITNLDRYIYSMALELQQPFSAEELLEAVRVNHDWKIELIKQRCKRCVKQKMLRRTGHFGSVRYECLLSAEDIKNATYIYSKTFDSDKLSFFMCGL